MSRRPEIVRTEASHWRDVLEPGETLLWEGRPKRLPAVRPISLALAAFGLPFLLIGLGLFPGILAGFGGPGPLFGRVALTLFVALVPLALTLTGLAFMVLPAYVGHHAPERVAYALTDRHAYVATRWLGQRVQRLPVSAFDIRTSDRAGGSISFWRVRTREGKTSRSFGFQSIGDPSDVEAIARRLTAGG